MNNPSNIKVRELYCQPAFNKKLSCVLVTIVEVDNQQVLPIPSAYL